MESLPLVILSGFAHVRVAALEAKNDELLHECLVKQLGQFQESAVFPIVGQVQRFRSHRLDFLEYPGSWHAKHLLASRQGFDQHSVAGTPTEWQERNVSSDGSVSDIGGSSGWFAGVTVGLTVRGGIQWRLTERRDMGNSGLQTDLNRFHIYFSASRKANPGRLAIELDRLDLVAAPECIQDAVGRTAHFGVIADPLHVLQKQVELRLDAEEPIARSLVGLKVDKESQERSNYNRPNDDRKSVKSNTTANIDVPPQAQSRRFGAGPTRTPSFEQTGL